MVTSKIKSKFKDSVPVLDDMGDTLNKDIVFYFTEGRHYNIQMIVMCHKTAQIINTARMSCDTIYLTSYNGAGLFKNFNDIYKCEHNLNKKLVIYIVTIIIVQMECQMNFVMA